MKKFKIIKVLSVAIKYKKELCIDNIKELNSISIMDYLIAEKTILDEKEEKEILKKINKVFY